MKGIMKQVITVVAIAFVFFVLLVIVTRGQVASGGQFALQKTVVAGGGREKQSLGTSPFQV